MKISYFQKYIWGNYGQNSHFDLTGYIALNIEGNNSEFCKSVVYMVHRIDIKFYILEVDIWFVMWLESLFDKRAVKPYST